MRCELACATTAFFCSGDHLSAWRREQAADEAGFRLSIEEGWRLAAPVRPEPRRPRYPGTVVGRLDIEEPCSGGRRFRRRSQWWRLRSRRHRRRLRPASAPYSGRSGAQVALHRQRHHRHLRQYRLRAVEDSWSQAAETLHNARAATRFAGITAEAELDRLAQHRSVRRTPSLSNCAAPGTPICCPPIRHCLSRGAARLIGRWCRGGRARAFLAGKIIIATGARLAMPAIPGIETVPYPDQHDRARPCGATTIVARHRRGGYIGAELAQMFSRAGVRVTLSMPVPFPPRGRARDRRGAERDILQDEGSPPSPGVAYRLRSARPSSVHCARCFARRPEHHDRRRSGADYHRARAQHRRSWARRARHHRLAEGRHRCG